MNDICWVAAAYYPLAVTSAVLPWVNAELLMLSAVPLADTPGELGVLVAVVTAGQMTGKGAMFWVARLAKGSRAARIDGLLRRWAAIVSRRRGSIAGILLVSSIAGVPPFYLVSVGAGAFGVAFGRFLAIGTIGRLIHFGTIALVPHLLWREL